MQKFQLREIEVKSILTKSKLPETDYVINPYIGCMHSCVYCYAVFMKRFTNHKEPWGRFVDVKINSVKVLEKEIKTAKKGVVLLSSVTDAYHPIEIKYELTREILKILLKYQFPISILTKSDLVTRDLDILTQFKNCNVGFSFLSFDNRHRKDFEPVATPPQKRLEAMKRLKENGIQTYAFIGPIFPFLTDLTAMFKKFKELKTDFIFCENLNHKAGTWQEISKTIKTKYPELSKKYEGIFFANNEYWIDVENQIIKVANEFDIKTKVFFHHNN